MGLDTPHGGTSIGIYNHWGSYDTYDFASRSRSLKRGSLHSDHGTPVGINTSRCRDIVWGAIVYSVQNFFNLVFDTFLFPVYTYHALFLILILKSH